GTTAKDLLVARDTPLSDRRLVWCARVTLDACRTINRAHGECRKSNSVLGRGHLPRRRALSHRGGEASYRHAVADSTAPSCTPCRAPLVVSAHPWPSGARS